VRFEVLTAASMQMAVVWVVAPCSLVEVYQNSLITTLPDYTAQQPRRQSSEERRMNRRNSVAV
jgi:hypothetical protein